MTKRMAFLALPHTAPHIASRPLRSRKFRLLFRRTDCKTALFFRLSACRKERPLPRGKGRFRACALILLFLSS